MSTDLARTPNPPAPSFCNTAPDDAPTDRFAFQQCPHCTALTTVPLSLAESPCNACGESVPVCPLDAEARARDFSTAPVVRRR
jgi:hypothetical protein